MHLTKWKSDQQTLRTGHIPFISDRIDQKQEEADGHYLCQRIDQLISILLDGLANIETNYCSLYLPDR